MNQTSTYADFVGQEYETLQSKLVYKGKYFAGVRPGRRVSTKHRLIAKLVRYYFRAEYGFKFKPLNKVYK